MAVAHADSIGSSIATVISVVSTKTGDRGSHDAGKECRYADDCKSFRLNVEFGEQRPADCAAEKPELFAQHQHRGK